jgi:AICAR transformylase/IMP cyclohydrolase PurH
VSVSDKTGLDALAPVLARFNVEILSTGGTASKLRELGLTVKDVAGNDIPTISYLISFSFTFTFTPMCI